MASKSAIAIAELRAQAVAKEMEKKQNLMRLKWFEENYERVYLNPALPPDKIPKKAAVLYEELRKRRKERFKADREIKSNGISLPQVKEENGEDVILEPMYPVPRVVKDILYKGWCLAKYFQFQILLMNQTKNCSEPSNTIMKR